MGFIRRLFSEPEKRDLTSECLRRYLPTCDVCGRLLHDGHRYVEIASIVLTGDKRQSTKGFFDAIRDRHWKTLRSFPEFEGGEDDLVAYLILCPQGSGSVVTVLDPVELYANPQCQTIDPISASEVNDILPLLGDAEWRPA